jgi:hypothetical protein
MPRQIKGCGSRFQREVSTGNFACSDLHQVFHSPLGVIDIAETPAGMRLHADVATPAAAVLCNTREELALIVDEMVLIAEVAPASYVTFAASHVVLLTPPALPHPRTETAAIHAPDK